VATAVITMTAASEVELQYLLLPQGSSRGNGSINMGRGSSGESLGSATVAGELQLQQEAWPASPRAVPVAVVAALRATASEAV
jgi:hypothetical protein